MQTAVIIFCLAPFVIALGMIVGRAIQLCMHPRKGLDRFD